MPIYKSTLNTNKKPKKEKEKKERVKMSKEKKKKLSSLSLLIISILCFALLIIKTPIQTFLLGMFGIFAYPMFLSIALLSFAGLTNKKYVMNKRYVICLCFSLFFIITVIHLILTRNVSIASYGKYLKETYLAQTTGAGLILSLITFPLVKYLTVVGAYVFTIIGLIISVGLTIDCVVGARYTPQKEKPKTDFNFNEFETLNANTNDVSVNFTHKQEDLKRKIAKQKLGLEKQESSIISTSMPIENIMEKLPKSRPMSKQEYILTPPEIVIPEYSREKLKAVERKTVNFNDIIVNDAEDYYFGAKVIDGKDLSSNKTINTNSSYSQAETSIASQPKTTVEKTENINLTPIPEINANNNLNNSLNEAIKIPNLTNPFTNTDNITSNSEAIQNDNVDNLALDINQDLEEDIDLNLEENFEEEIKEVEEKPSLSTLNKTEFTTPFAKENETIEIRPKANFDNPNNTFTKELVKEPEQNKLGRPKKHYAPYVRPPVELLNHFDHVDVVTDEECNENIEKLEQVLEDFKIPAKVKAVQVGPAVTRYEIGMPTGVSVKKVQMHADDIAMVLASNGGIRIEAPIPGKNAVGIEVPNKNITAVSLREMVESLDFQKRVNPMSFVLGKDINGAIQFCNLDKMPHLLVAGSTGSGKSVCLNTMLISMLYKSSPEDVRLILIDPKTVEFSVYANIPHLLTPHIITTKEQAINALNWAIKEMEYRYTLLQQNEVVNIKDYNNLPIVRDGEVQKLPYIVIVIDELNDLMIETKREMEERIMKLAQKSRAAGIHLVIATQRPSVDVITGTIKANLPSRIAFALTNFADSKTVLDMGGAEKLLGRGDMLFKPNDMPEPRRVQGAYVSSQEVSAVVKFIKANNPTDFDDSTLKAITATPETNDQPNHNGGNNRDSFDPIMKDALRWFISANQASITMIQRRFGVGYSRAARIVDQMEQNGFVSSQDGSKPRQVLISLEQFNALFGE